MFKNLTILITTFLLLLHSCSSSRMKTTEIRYFNENNVEITKSEFNKNLSTHQLLDIPGDSIHHRKLKLREKRGQIKNRPGLQSILEKATNQEIDPNKPIVIVFHPGKDACNSSGTNTSEWIKTWYGQLEDGLYQVAQVKPLYIYKENTGLENYKGILTWHKDPDRTIEKMFFEHHYPCKSFVVIAADGRYISYFGEFAKEYVWEAVQLLNK